ncbi:MAG: L-iditol 2-dehydrogenase GutB [Rhodobacteraceae bacterium HLUCCA08]|nr:MAG: L-iditol 2-dehydrogenase GutB [Rhodobacteraceae bacterium HLUCCA08]
MQAITYPERGRVSRTALPDPTPGPGEVLVRVMASGICHTDLEILHGNYGADAFPVIPGHEFAGIVGGLGAGVTGLAEGDRVVVDPNLGCGACPACARGWAHLCTALGAYGVTRPGGFADLCVVRAAAVHPIGDMPFAMAALAEPMGCVLNGIDAVDPQVTETALIFGAGAIGLLMAIALRTRGIDRIALVDLDAARLELARGFGFEALAAGSAVLEDRRQAIDFVADATGVPEVAGTLTRYIANGGRGLYFGVCPQPARIEIAPFEMFRRQITLAGTHSLNHNIPQALQAMSDFGPDIAGLVSHRLDLDGVARIMAEGAPKGSLKIQARWA